MPQQSKNIRNCGYTLIEIVVAIAIVGIVTIGAGVLLANSQQSWGQLFDRVYGDPTIDSVVAQAAFDGVCRKASARKYVMGDSGDSLELYYWEASSTASTPELYSRFYQDSGQLRVEHGKTQSGTWQPDPTETTTTVTLASNIQSVTFSAQGTSMQMYLTYSDTDLMPVVCSSVRHNE